jgi:anaerobic ribonucleoside-triphosphate reductase
MKCPVCGSTDCEVNGLFYLCNNCGQLDDSTFSMIMEKAIPCENEFNPHHPKHNSQEEIN